MKLRGIDAPDSNFSFDLQAIVRKTTEDHSSQVELNTVVHIALTQTAIAHGVVSAANNSPPHADEHQPCHHPSMLSN